MDFTFIDNSDFFKEAMSLVAIYALTKCGMTTQRYAQLLCPVDTGNLRNSITYPLRITNPPYVWARTHAMLHLLHRKHRKMYIN